MGNATVRWTNVKGFMPKGRKVKQMNIDKTQYKQDAKGNLVPLANIKEIDLLRDELVQEIAAKARAVQDNLMAFKREAMDDIAGHSQD